MTLNSVTKQFYEFSAKDSRNEIEAGLKARLRKVVGSEGVTSVKDDFIANYFIELLKSKDQNEFNKKMLRWQVGLVLATWALVGVTYLATRESLCLHFNSKTALSSGFKEKIDDKRLT